MRAVSKNQWNSERFTNESWSEAKRFEDAFVRGHLPKFNHGFVIRRIHVPVDGYAHLCRFVSRIQQSDKSMNRILDEDHPPERNGLVCRLRRDEEITAQNVAGSTQAPHLFRTLLTTI